MPISLRFFHSTSRRFMLLMLVAAGSVVGLTVRRASAVPEGHFVVNGDDTVTDADTGLMWQQTHDAVGRENSSAKGYCNGLELAGHDDWRLPEIYELLSIVDEKNSYDTTHKSSFDPIAFPTGGAVGFWSATAFKGNTNASWIVDFSVGYSGTRSYIDTYSVRCVRTNE